MKSRATALWRKIRNIISSHPIYAGIFFLLVLGAVILINRGNGNENIAIRVVSPGEFIRNVSVAGKIIPAREVELGFENSGRVAAVYKNVGDKVYAGQTLAVLSSGDVGADIRKAEADTDAEIARLNELKANSANIGTELKTKQISLVEALKEGYAKSDDAVRNNVDQFYDNPKEKADIRYAFNDVDLKKYLDKERDRLEYILEDWLEKVQPLTASNYTESDVRLAETNLNIIQNFLDQVALAVNDFQDEGRGYTQAEIDKFKTDVASARESINSAIENLTEAKEGIRDVESEIPYQEAKVKAAEAAVLSLRAELGKRTISAPFNGVVTIQNAKVGEIVSSSDKVITLISDRTYQIETFVPEININEIKVGNIAKVTLDAFMGKEDENTFEAKVIAVDPGETIKDGVSTYKVTFEFVKEDARLKPGMTANVVITTGKKSDAILIPEDALIHKNGFTYVKVKVGGQFIEKQVTPGASSANGEIEIVAGLSSGEAVILEPDKLEI